MSNPIAVVYASVWEDGGLYLMARLLGNLGVNITQASLTSITIKVYIKGTDALISTLTPVVASTVFDTLQTTLLDPRWTKDATGYNFGYTVPAASFPEGDTIYLLDVTFDPAAGDNFFLVAEVETLRRIPT